MQFHCITEAAASAAGRAPAPLVAVVGPTGSGKSEVAIAIAREFGGEAVNCDSLQVYRYFDIGTAKLPPEARQGVPHHLIDILNPDEVFTAGDYARRARPVLAEITERSKLPIVVGGTGLYLRALVDGLFPGPERDPAVRSRLAAREQRRPGSLYRLLRRLDPGGARRIHPHDLPKLTRALEIRLLAGQPATALFTRGRDRLDKYRILKIGLFPDREALYRRLDERCARMFDSGLLEEVRKILARGFPETCKPFESHGYRQALQFLRGELTLTEASYYSRRNTRHYAKRQMTWFLQESEVERFAGFGEDPIVRPAIFSRLRHFLTSHC